MDAEQGGAADSAVAMIVPTRLPHHLLLPASRLWFCHSGTSTPLCHLQHAKVWSLSRGPLLRPFASCTLQVVFFLPQLVQLLRGDDGAISSFFLTTARHSDVFAHNLMWALASESRPPEEAFNPEVKRWVTPGWY
jgi:hypothetical protein